MNNEQTQTYETGYVSGVRGENGEIRAAEFRQHHTVVNTILPIPKLAIGNFNGGSIAIKHPFPVVDELTGEIVFLCATREQAQAVIDGDIVLAAQPQGAR
jgi:hypothetical protein